MKRYTNIIDCLQDRDFIEAKTSENLREVLNKPSRVYIGFDPTSDSLHLGNLVGIIALSWFQKFGHTPVVVLGGATGKIGDPSGKSQERPFLGEKDLLRNVEEISKSFTAILDFKVESVRPIILNNQDWLDKWSLIDFLRDIGKHFRLSQMIAKESVRVRIESEEGISFTEFSYQILQAFDFYYLFENFKVILQMGGSDQWGNITAGIELIRKLVGKQSFGLTFPLLTRSDGKKFGKTEEGAIWLSKEKCSPYQFYQYFFTLPDQDIPRLMRMITFMDLEEIREIENQMGKNGYVPNTAQRRLAEEVTGLVHGKEGLAIAKQVTEAASPGKKAKLQPEILKQIAKNMPHIMLSSSEVIGEKFVELSVKIGLLPSKGEAVRLIQNGGAYLNEEKVENPSLKVEREDLIGGIFLLFGAGKKKKILVEIKK
ncbi:MAG: tyrosine--tRNA ligase [Chlamydiae bacterium]|nr:tyrosine--tRNA ligase [Chlamydiota bacterium]